MRYRIKITRFANGRSDYVAQYRGRFFWLNLTYLGDAQLEEVSASDKREHALERIDKHYHGNNKKVFIEFEYIDKP